MQLLNEERYKDATWRIDRAHEYSNTTKFDPRSSKSSYVTNKKIKISYVFFLIKNGAIFANMDNQLSGSSLGWGLVNQISR